MERTVGNQSQTILDTLFVELINPPRGISVPGLPDNVVALGKTAKNTWCTLPDDTTIQIAREQVLVLPNFAMTDYASQGKTRPINVVDLNNCRTHFSYYTAMSRGTTSEGTLIVQGMDSSKITKGISGYLRQEFRELEILNEITRLRYEGVPMPSVQGVNRKELIQSYYKWKGGHFDSVDLHPVLRYRPGDEREIRAGTVTGKWELVGTDKPKTKKDESLKEKSKAATTTKCKSDSDESPIPKKKSTKTVQTPVGLIWDSQNHSCAYDALFTCMYNVWVAHGAKWSAKLSTINGYNALLANGFDAVTRKTRTIEYARNAVRGTLTADHPAYFPTGSSLTSLDRLIETMFGGTYWGSETEKCTGCMLVKRADPGAQCLATVTVDNLLRSRHKSSYSLSHWVAANRVRYGRRSCAGCGNGTTVFEHFQTPPPLLVFSLSDDNVLIDHLLNIDVGGQKTRYAVRGAIYSGSNHFTARCEREWVGLVSRWYRNRFNHGA
ncbi:hypothetical protein K438DRAFT_1599658 [Mycena galopus ATCC 62051]|nr:hypothetical protein K438DRAFT_1599658 [Mycena galopus ATCC 62051]